MTLKEHSVKVSKNDVEEVKKFLIKPRYWIPFVGLILIWIDYVKLTHRVSLSMKLFINSKGESKFSCFTQILFANIILWICIASAIMMFSFGGVWGWGLLFSKSDVPTLSRTIFFLAFAFTIIGFGFSIYFYFLPLFYKYHLEHALTYLEIYTNKKSTGDICINL